MANRKNPLRKGGRGTTIEVPHGESTNHSVSTEKTALSASDDAISDARDDKGCQIPLSSVASDSVPANRSPLDESSRLALGKLARAWPTVLLHVRQSILTLAIGTTNYQSEVSSEQKIAAIVCAKCPHHHPARAMRAYAPVTFSLIRSKLSLTP